MLEHIIRRIVGRRTAQHVASPSAVIECLSSVDGETVECEALVARGSNSTVYRARRGGQPIAVKECFDSAHARPDPAAAEAEFAALTTLSNAAASLAVLPLAPLPLLLCRENGVYAMTWIPGRRATEMILARSTTVEEATKLGQSAGKWLSRFHALGPLKTGTNDFETKLGLVRDIGERAGKGDALIQRATAALIKSSADATAIRMPASWIHGDMKSDNLLVDGGKAMGIDLRLSHENSVAYDLAPFLNHLSLLRWTTRGIWQEAKLRATGVAFLQAYSSESTNWKLALDWLRAYLLIQVIGTFQTSGTSPRSLYVQWAARRSLTEAIDDLKSA